MIATRRTKVKVYSGIVAYFKEILVEVTLNEVRHLNGNILSELSITILI